MRTVVLGLGLLAVLSLLVVGCQTGRVTGKAYDESSTVDGKGASRISFMQAMKSGECRRVIGQARGSGLAVAYCNNDELAISGFGSCYDNGKRSAISSLGYVEAPGVLPGSIEAIGWQINCMGETDSASVDLLCCKK